MRLIFTTAFWTLLFLTFDLAVGTPLPDSEDGDTSVVPTSTLNNNNTLTDAKLPSATYLSLKGDIAYQIDADWATMGPVTGYNGKHICTPDQITTFGAPADRKWVFKCGDGTIGMSVVGHYIDTHLDVPIKNGFRSMWHRFSGNVQGGPYSCGPLQCSTYSYSLNVCKTGGTEADWHVCEN